jgi:hypothetical protein
MELQLAPYHSMPIDRGETLEGKNKKMQELETKNLH